MDIAAMSTNMQLQKVQNQASVAMLDKNIEATQTTATQIVEMIHDAGNAQEPNKGQNINTFA